MADEAVTYTSYLAVDELLALAIDRFADGSRAAIALRARYDAPTLWDAFLRYLSREGYAVPASQLAREVAARIGLHSDPCSRSPVFQ